MPRDCFSFTILVSGQQQFISIFKAGGNFFDVFFDVEVNSNALHIASFQFPHPELLIFVTPVVVPNENGIHVQFGVRRTDGVPLQELFSIELHGHFIPEPSTLTLAALALLSLLAHGHQRRDDLTLSPDADYVGVTERRNR